jgi:hypothetical protein
MDFFDYDAHTGVTTETAQEDEITVVHRMQDVSALIEKARLERDLSMHDKGIKQGFWKVATVPIVIQAELLKKGIQIPVRDNHEFKRLMTELKENYPYLLTTDKRVI